MNINLKKTFIKNDNKTNNLSIDDCNINLYTFRTVYRCRDLDIVGFINQIPLLNKENTILYIYYAFLKSTFHELNTLFCRNKKEFFVSTIIINKYNLRDFLDDIIKQETINISRNEKCPEPKNLVPCKQFLVRCYTTNIEKLYSTFFYIINISTNNYILYFPKTKAFLPVTQQNYRLQLKEESNDLTKALEHESMYSGITTEIPLSDDQLTIIINQYQLINTDTIKNPSNNDPINRFDQQDFPAKRDAHNHKPSYNPLKSEYPVIQEVKTYPQITEKSLKNLNHNILKMNALLKKNSGKKSTLFFPAKKNLFFLLSATIIMIFGYHIQFIQPFLVRILRIF
ncbi:hypothetical protein EKK58_02485 [Candidatus Dependentiae bacterium]|nr:MAG: hypothetical protein EKK58_02485 [Candidatus Dependentiae bacterium]